MVMTERSEAFQPIASVSVVSTFLSPLRGVDPMKLWLDALPKNLANDLYLSTQQRLSG